MLNNPVEEAKDIIAVASDRKVVLRLLGGIVINIRCPSASRPGLNREYIDIDFIGLRSQRTAISRLFLDLNYAPRTAFNAMSGGTELIFNDLEHQRRVDIFLDIIRLHQKIEDR